MAHVNANGTPTKGRIGGWSYFESIFGIIVRIATNIVPKGRKQSKAQRVVQLALANWVILWRKFAKRLEPTFSLRPDGESEYNAFVRANWKRMSIYLTKEMVETGACVVPPCEINHGDLDPSVLYWKDATDNWMVTDLLLGDLVIDANTTVGEFSRAVTTCNPAVFPDQGQLAKAHFIDFFCAQQVINIDTRFPDVRIIGHSLRLDDKSQEKLWEVTGGSEGFQSFKGHLATPYTAKDLYAWVRLEQKQNDEYHGTTQSLMGDNTATINRYTTEAAFMAACESYGGFSQKFLLPYKAKCNTFHYELRTFATVPGENPIIRDEEDESSAPTYTLAAVANPAGSATFTFTPEGPYHEGDQVQVRVTPASGYSFSSWQGGGSQNPLTVTIGASNQTLTANLTSTNQGGGEVELG